MTNVLRAAAIATALVALRASAQDADAGVSAVPHVATSPVADATAITQVDAGVPEAAAVPLASEHPDDVAPPSTVPALARWYDRVRPYGYAKVGVFYTFPAQDDQLLGSNGGFRLAALRLGMQISLADSLTVVTSIEGNARRPSAEDPTVGTRVVDLRDAYLDWTWCRGATLRVGQFKAPFWAETLLGDDLLPFITRSPVSDGVLPPEGFGPQTTLTLDRQIGLQLSSSRLGGETFGLRYAVAVVNGNGANQLFNDNNIVAPVGRLEVDLMQKVTLGVNGYFNVKTDGIRTNRLNVSQVGYGADLKARWEWLSALVGVVGRSSTYGTAGLPAESAIGVLGQVHGLWAKYGIEGGVRVTYFEPSSTQVDDQLIEIAAMAGYRFKAWPVRTILQFTHRQEAAAVAVPNDSLDAMLQVAW
ncbi:MAG: OprO/OprP family phosphate-selective porin [Myxococcaceae bacterium]|nr:OprO/OprP family phosphate-selective porin [Myxococcaceae bacterium]